MGSVKLEGDTVVIRIPRSEVHGLRVALHPIMQGEPTSAATKQIRESLERALARVEAENG